MWWIVVVAVVGVAVVGLWNRRVEAPSVPSTESTPSSHVQIAMRNHEFEPREVVVPIGTTVDWVDTEGKHGVQFDENGPGDPQDAVDVGARRHGWSGYGRRGGRDAAVEPRFE